MSAALLLPACDAEDSSPPDPSEIADAAGKQDGFEGIEIGLGESLELSVRARHGEPLSQDHAKALQLHIPAGHSFALVMRATGGDPAFDPYLELFEAGDSLATSDRDQAVAPMAAESDAIVFGHATEDTTYVAVAADLELAVDARFRVDLVDLDAELPDIDLTRTSPGLRALMEAQRELEPDVSNAVHTGALVEVAEGKVEAHRIEGQSLRELADMRGLAVRLNDLRSQYYDWLTEDAPSGSRELVTVALPQLWSQLR
jgi:hypothetical protein